jgi:tetratricopeptide (TPR) repeat protein
VRPHVGLVGLPSVLSRVWVMWSFAELGDFVAARPIGEEAMQIAERADHPYSLITAYFGVGGFHLRRGELAPAMAVLERALALCRVWDTQLRQWFLGVAPSLGHAYALAGRVEEAISLLHDSMDQAATAGMLYAQPLRIAWLADAYRRAGKLVDARELARRALDMARGQRERGHEVWVLGILADIASYAASYPESAAHADPAAHEDSAAADFAAHADFTAADEAEAIYREALALAESLGMRPRLAVGQLGLGRLLRRTGRLNEAVEHLSVAVDFFRAMEMPWWLAQAEAEHAAAVAG